jgi:hypothetical protein
MKGISIFIAVCLLITFSACHTSSSSGTSVTPLNSEKNQLIGTWHLTKQVVANGLTDTAYTGYGSTWYVIFKSNQYGSTSTGGGANWKEVSQAFVLGAPPTTGNPATTTSYWYYEPTTSMLNIAVQQYSIVTLNSSQLVIKRATNDYTLYFNK